MSLEREELLQLVLARLQTLVAAGTLKTVSRRFRDGDVTSPDDCPLANINLGRQDMIGDPIPGAPRLYRVTLNVQVAVVDGGEGGPAPRLNGAVDAIEDCLDVQWTLEDRRVESIVLASVEMGTDLKDRPCIWADLEFEAQVWG